MSFLMELSERNFDFWEETSFLSCILHWAIDALRVRYHENMIFRRPDSKKRPVTTKHYVKNMIFSTKSKFRSDSSIRNPIKMPDTKFWMIWLIEKKDFKYVKKKVSHN